MNNNYTVYIHKNKITNEMYIGQTCQKPEKRWDNGKGYVTSPKFYNAILKYGWENFEHIIVKSGLSQQEANVLEESLIKTHKTQEFGYNIQFGGNNHKLSEETKRKIGEANKISLKGNTWSDEQRELMSKMFSGENNPFYGKTHSEETKQKISSALKGKHKGEKHPFYGKTHSQDSLNKMSQNRRGKGGKKVKCINTGEIFECMMDAARWCGLSTSCSIGQVCNKTNKQKSAGKHPKTGEKLFWEFYEEEVK